MRSYITIMLICSWFLCQGQVNFLPDFVRVPLDETKGFYNKGTCGFTTPDGINYLYIHHNDVAEILKYKIETNGKSELVETIKYEKEGPYSVGKIGIDGISVFNENQIYLYSYWGKTVYQLNSKGKAVKKYNLVREGPTYPVLETSDNQRICPLGKDEILMYGHLYKTSSENEISPPFVAIDLDEAKHTYFGAYNKKTFKGNWGGVHKTYCDCIPNDGFVSSFSISDSIMIYKNNMLDKKIFAKSKHIEDLDPIHEDYDFDYAVDKNKFHNYTLSSQYFGVRYDKYRDVYYRFGVLKSTLQDFSELKHPRFALLVIDANNNIIYDELIPSGLYPQHSFITSDGLFLLDKNSYDNVSDDYLSYTVVDVCNEN